MEGRHIPIAGIVLALTAGGVMMLAGVSVWLVAAALLVWIGSLWLSAPPPERPAQPLEGVQLTRTGMHDLLEHSGLPMLMLDSNRIIVANAAAREAIGAHILGQDARVAFRHPAAVDLLSREGGGSASVQGLSGPRSSWQMTRQPIDERYSLIELVDRTSEADVSRAHTDFVANASHELRTPLASIIGYMETLVEAGEAIDAKRAERFHGVVLQEAKRLQSLVDDLMSLSLVEAEKHDHPRDKIKFAALVQQAARDGAGPERQERLDLLKTGEKLVVRGDRKQLEQLVRNLVDNALKYGAPESSVTVGVDRGERDMAVLTVRDRGEGIAPEHIPHLTRRFYRTDPGRSRAAGGTGLGLAIVKHIVERHRGRLDIASTLGEGTTVTVRLPLAD
jgi:two-component system, OmpR family, phosphate regulon sensor histidine kinase PhoR